MNIKKRINSFWKYFLHPRVIIFLVLGVCIIFFTFLTDDNALEIAISGIASVFIGIGVNNFSAFDTEAKDELKLKAKLNHSIKIMTMCQEKIERLHHDFEYGNTEKIAIDFAGLNNFMKLGIEMLQEDNLLNNIK
jgi:hypothetical protein